MRRSFIVLGTFFLMLGSVVGQTYPRPPRRPVPVPRAEALLGFMANSYGIMLRVNSCGYTNKNDFRVEVTRGYEQNITFHRVRRSREPCRYPIAYGQELRFTYEELGISRYQRFRVLNDVYTVVNGQDPY
ncbi:hypothetical protein OAB57_01365 [Bacteriovoracaceae bacterium]|nr:hypothetical protein [Bacteriovoracaceae bacterium]